MGKITLTVYCVQSEFERAGGVFREGARVVSIEWRRTHPLGHLAVVLANGERITCERLVLAPGPWAAQMFNSLGIHLPLVVCCLLTSSFSFTYSFHFHWASRFLFFSSYLQIVYYLLRPKNNLRHLFYQFPIAKS